MASKAIKFIIVAALACLVTVSGDIDLPNGVYCTATNNTACTQRYPNSHCNQEAVCTYGTGCQCDIGYTQYTFLNTSAGFIAYSCRPATVLVGEQCSNQLGNTCSGYRTFCQQATNNQTYSDCRCLGNYKPNAGRTDCIPLNLNQNCTDGECGVNAYCDSSSMLCRCLPGYKTFNATDCTHYQPGDECPTTECDFQPTARSCGYGSCKTGSFQCAAGSTWWKITEVIASNPDVPQIVNGMCLSNEVEVVGTGHLCDTSNYMCRSSHCVMCPEQSDISICNGAVSSKQLSVSVATFLLLLACYL